MLKSDSLFKKIALWQCAALLLFALITGALFSVSYAQYTYDNYLIEIARSISRSISSHVENSGYSPGSKEPSEINAYIDLISSASNLSHITVWIVTDKKELISYNNKSGKLEFDQLPTRYTEMLDHMLQGNDVHNNTYRKVWNRNMFGVGTPVVDSGGFVIGVVLVQTSYSVVFEALETAMLDLFFSLLIALAVTLFIAVTVSKILTKPLEKIQESATQLCDGNYDVRTGIDTDDELGRLAEAIDSLAQRLAAAREEQEGMEQMRQDFISGISHELRTPVTVMRASLEALCDGLVTDPDKVSQYHQTMLHDSVQLHRLIQDLLDLSRLRAHGLSMNMTVCNPCEIAREAISSVQTLADKKNITIQFRCLCNACCHCSITADYGRIRQLFTILADNAVKFTAPGRNVFVSMNYTDHLVCIVEDEGCGIPEDELSSIFERFYSGQTGEGSEGCGLGLAIAAEIAGHHGIDIQVQSQLDHGTRFTLTFPA